MAVTRKLAVAEARYDYSRRYLTRDGNGRLYLLYTTGQLQSVNQDLLVYYSDDEGDNWHSEILIAGGVYKWQADLAIDSAGNLHIAYMTGTGYGDRRLWYLKGAPGSWGVPEDVMGGAYLHFLTMAIDGNDIPHLIVTDYPDYDLHHYWKNGSWSAEFIESQSYPLTEPMIAIDGDNNIHISYARMTGPIPVMYRKRTTGWSDPETVIAQSSAYRSCICVDAMPSVHVAVEGDLYNRRNGSWAGEETVTDQGSSPGAFPEVAVGGDGIVWDIGSGWIFKREGGSWIRVGQTYQDALYDPDAGFVSVLWAYWPEIHGARVCVAESGLMYAYYDTPPYQGLWVYSDDAVFPDGHPRHDMGKIPYPGTLADFHGLFHHAGLVDKEPLFFLSQFDNLALFFKRLLAIRQDLQHLESFVTIYPGLLPTLNTAEEVLALYLQRLFQADLNHFRFPGVGDWLPSNPFYVLAVEE